jgi:hypothetical protein
MRSIEKFSVPGSQFSVLLEKPNGKGSAPKAAFHSYHGPRYNGCSPRDQFGLSFFCAAGNLERRFLAASFASSARGRVDWTLPRLGAGSRSVRRPHTGILQPWLCYRLSPSSASPRLGCGPLFNCPRQPGAGYDLLCLRTGPRSDRTWRIDLRSDRRGLAQCKSGPARAHACELLSAGISRAAERCSCLIGSRDSESGQAADDR